MAKNVTIARLNTLVTANAAQFTKEMDRAAAIAKSRGAGINKALSSVGNIAGTLGVGLSVGAVIGFGKSVIDLGGQITDLASVADLSGRGFQTISVLAGDAGLSMEEVAKASERMRSKIQDAKNNGSDPLNKSLAKLGLTSSGLAALTTDEKWQAIANKLSNATDQQEAMNIASDIFGDKIGPKLRAAFEGISAGVDNASAAMSQLIIPDATRRRLDEAGDKMLRLGKYTLVFGAALFDPKVTFNDLGESLRKEFTTLDATCSALDRLHAAWSRILGLPPIPDPNHGLPKADPRIPRIDEHEPNGFQLPKAPFDLNDRQGALIKQKMLAAEATQANKNDLIDELLKEKAKKAEISSLLDLFFDEVDEKSKELADGRKRMTDEQKKRLDDELLRQKNAKENEQFLTNKAFTPNTPTDAYSRIGLKTDVRTPGAPSQKEQTDLLRKIHERLKETVSAVRSVKLSGSAAYSN